MPNKNYIKGVRKERKIVNQARENGHIAFRSAGSHSPIDVCIIDRKERKIYLVQCKPESMSEKKKQEIVKELGDLYGNFVVDFRVV